MDALVEGVAGMTGYFVIQVMHLSTIFLRYFVCISRHFSGLGSRENVPDLVPQHTAVSR